MNMGLVWPPAANCRDSGIPLSPLSMRSPSSSASDGCTIAITDAAIGETLVFSDTLFFPLFTLEWWFIWYTTLQRYSKTCSKWWKLTLWGRLFSSWVSACPSRRGNAKGSTKMSSAWLVFEYLTNKLFLKYTYKSQPLYIWVYTDASLSDWYKTHFKHINTITMLVFWVVPHYGLVLDKHRRFGGTYWVHPFSLEDTGSMFLRNVCVYLQVYMALQSRRPLSSAMKMDALLWEPQITYINLSSFIFLSFPTWIILPLSGFLWSHILVHQTHDRLLWTSDIHKC
jgi:hypothetical protein